MTLWDQNFGHLVSYLFKSMPRSVNDSLGGRYTTDSQ